MKPKSKPKTTTTNDTAHAERWHCDERTIRRWRGKSAPLDDDAAMVRWLAVQRSIPAGTLALVMAEQRKNRVEVSAAALALPAGTPGTPGALKRLEGEEEKTYRAVIAAEQSGNPLEYKLATQRWVSLSRELLRYDLAVQQSRRADELVERSAVEAALEKIGRIIGEMKHEMAKIVPQLYGASAQNIAEQINVAAGGALRGALGYYIGNERGLPDWCAAAITRGFENPDGQEWTPAQCERVRDLVSYLSTMSQAQLRAQTQSVAAEIITSSSMERDEYRAWKEARRKDSRREYLRRCLKHNLPAFGMEAWEEQEFPTLEKLDWKNPDHVRRMDEWNKKSFEERGVAA